MASGTHKGGRVSRTRLLESSVLAARWAGPDVCSRPKGSDFPGPGSREHAQGPNPQAIPGLPQEESHCILQSGCTPYFGQESSVLNSRAAEDTCPCLLWERPGEPDSCEGSGSDAKNVKSPN